MCVHNGCFLQCCFCMSALTSIPERGTLLWMTAHWLLLGVCSHHQHVCLNIQCSLYMGFCVWFVKDFNQGNMRQAKHLRARCKIDVSNSDAASN